MVELELSTSNLSSKVHSSIDLRFLVAPRLHNYIGNEEGCPEQLTLLKEHFVGNCMLGDHIDHHFELGNTNVDMVCHDFPQIANANTAEGNIGGHSFHSRHRDSFQAGLPYGLMGRNCLYGFAENVSPVLVNEAVGNDVGHSFEHNNVHKDIPHILGESISVFDNNLFIQEIGTSQELPVGDLYETADLMSRPLSTFDSILNNSETICSGFGRNQDQLTSFRWWCFIWPAGESGPTSLSVMPICRTDEDISAPTMPMDENLGSKDGCSKAITRQQATIKMDEDGSFSFKNLGQRLVLVNSEEVAKGQRHILSSF